MKLPERCISPPASGPGAAAAPVATLRCISSGYLREGGRCECRIPEHVVQAGWRRAVEQGGTGEGFFRIAAREGQWLAFGHADGRVRGVYCPEHAADRDQRAVAAIARADIATPAAQLVA
jgi:hypothetical protein